VDGVLRHPEGLDGNCPPIEAWLAAMKPELEQRRKTVPPTGSGPSKVSEIRRRLFNTSNSERELRSLKYEVEALLLAEPGSVDARMLLDDVSRALDYVRLPPVATYEGPVRSAPRKSRWPVAIAVASIMIASASLMTFFQYGNQAPVAEPIAGDLSEGLVLEDLRPPDDESDQGREERSFASKIRFVGPSRTHVVTRTSAGQELVIKGYSLQGTIEGDILAVRDGKYASLETFAKSAEKSFEKGEGLVCPADSRLVLRSLTGDGKLTYKINGYVRSAGDGKPGPLGIIGNSRQNLQVALNTVGWRVPWAKDAVQPVLDDFEPLIQARKAWIDQALAGLDTAADEISIPAPELVRLPESEGNPADVIVVRKDDRQTLKREHEILIENWDGNSPAAAAAAFDRMVVNFGAMNVVREYRKSMKKKD
jgi:hypothetical protein